MQFSIKSGLVMILLSTLTAACTGPSAFQVREDVKKSLDANENSKTLAEWENSENNNEAIFKRWKDAGAKSEEVCKGLEDKTGKELSLFEEEIKSEEYQELLVECKQELLEKIENYWNDESKRTENLSIAKSNLSTFKFPNNVQIRDVSDGYRAVSADVAAKEVILTFDDGPHPEYTDKILAALESVNAKAIFFAQGKNVKAFPQVLRHVGAQGHAVGSHSWDHKCLPAKTICAKNNGKMLKFSEATAQIRDGHRAVLDVLGWVDPFFRFPYGESSAELKNYLKENSIGEFYWSIDSEDWKNRTPSEMLKYTMDQVDKRGRGNMLFHDVQRRTAEALPALLKQLYFKGYSIVLLQSANSKDRLNSKLAK